MDIKIKIIVDFENVSRSTLQEVINFDEKVEIFFFIFHASKSFWRLLLFKKNSFKFTLF